jgi:hypothetical protein
LVAVAGFVLGGIVVATGVVAAPAHDRKALDRSACKPELAWASQPSHDNLAPPSREPRAMMLLAVDRRLNGCRVLSPASAWQDVVPEPNFAKAPARRQPAVGG